jgi:CBS domain-containing protein
LWWRRGDRRSATVTAARAGRLFGLVLIGLGFADFLFTFSLGGLWLALIGWFVVTAAFAEEQQTVITATLAGMTVAEVMSPRPVTATPDETVASFIDHTVLIHRRSTYPLVDASGRFIGLVTLNRIRDVPTQARGTTRLGDIASSSTDVPTARPEERMTDLLLRMAGHPDSRAVVVNDTGGVIGVVTPSDISRALHVRELNLPS